LSTIGRIEALQLRTNRENTQRFTKVRGTSGEHVFSQGETIIRHKGSNFPSGNILHTSKENTKETIEPVE
jgi:hypothetical protein